jgi:hypothetical protein
MTTCTFATPRGSLIAPLNSRAPVGFYVINHCNPRFVAALSSQQVAVNARPSQGQVILYFLAHPAIYLMT